MYSVTMFRWFEDSDVDRIRNTTMANIIRETTSINGDLIQDNVFITTGEIYNDKHHPGFLSQLITV